MTIYVKRLVPVALFGAQDRAEVRIGGGVVDQDVNAAVDLDHALDQPLHGRIVAGVGRNCERVAARRCDLRGHGIQAFLLAAGQHYPRAGFGIASSDRCANAPRCARNQCNLPR